MAESLGRPDAMADLNALKRRMTALEEAVRRRGTPRMYELTDAVSVPPAPLRPLGKVQDGEVPVWSKPAGGWVAGSAGGGGGGDLTVGHFTSTIASVPSGGWGVDITGWAATPAAWAGFSTTLNHIVVETPGVYAVCGTARWEANATGARQIRMGGGMGGTNGLSPSPIDTRNAVSEEYWRTDQSTEWAFGQFDAGGVQDVHADAVVGGVNLEVRVDVYVVKLRGPT